MPRHFSDAEYADRQTRAVRAISDAGYDALLIFSPESQYWLCGYDTFGFAMFQCMVLTSSGTLHLLTRAPDYRQALFTSTLTEDQVHVWKDVEGVNPTDNLLRLLSRLEVKTSNIAAEINTAGLPHYYGKMLETALPVLQDGSSILPPLRRVKSEAEIACIRKAAALSDDALDAALQTAKAGAFEGDILANMQGAVFKGGGEYAGNEFILGSGDGALMCRSYAGKRSLSHQDQMTLEWSGSYMRYHAAMMRTVVIGTPNDTQIRMHAAAAEALEACENAIRPGAPMGDVFDAHAKVFDAHGLHHARLNACGYGMGAVFQPIWVEFPMFYEGNPLKMQANQAFFLHMILMDSDANLAMCYGHTVLCTETGVERLSRYSLDLLVR
ncbi:MAG: Xaa-Pro peptidase family protein [Paracoccaceae bacterium]|jgi:Xaa-Pro dipeptidase|nr:Xaa-Pro peptidase family protein [Paracoccaceae bacterium]MDP7184178.1 Xaa-Pro peptidase family protein [Paracoccaceae bacterium]